MVSQRKIRRLFRHTVATTEWFTYVNPHFNPGMVSINRSFLDRMSRLLHNNVGIDAVLDTSAMLAAELQKHHLPRLQALVIGQSEGIYTQPENETWYFGVMDDEYYISDTPFFPFE